MHIDACKEEYEQYIDARQELETATKAAQRFGLKMPVTGVIGDEVSPELEDDAKAAYRRLLKADHLYAEKYNAWTKCIANHSK